MDSLTPELLLNFENPQIFFKICEQNSISNKFSIFMKFVHEMSELFLFLF